VRLEIALRIDGTRNRISRGSKGDEKRVALRIDLTAALSGKRSTQNPAAALPARPVPAA